MKIALQLAENVNRKHGASLQKEMHRIFAFSEMVETAWLVAEKDGRIVGFDFLLGDGEAWKVVATGSDYSAGHLYFLLSDEDIRFAIDRGARKLSAGTHLYTVKTKIGYRINRDGIARFSGMSWPARLLSWTLLFRRRPPKQRS